LCSQGILLQKGEIVKSDTTARVIDFYLNPPKDQLTTHIPMNIERYGTSEAIYTSFHLTDMNNKIVDKLNYLQPFLMHFEVEVLRKVDDLHQFVCWTQIADEQGTIFTMSSSIDDGSEPVKLGIGKHRIISSINVILVPGNYFINIAISNMLRNIDNLTNVYAFEVSEIAHDSSKSYPWGAYRPGFIVPETKWSFD
jgi:hypothetical protein